MDINQWLEDAAAATRPKQPKPVMHPSEPLMFPATAPNPVRNHSRNGPSRSGADTSILAPEDTPREVSQVKAIKAARPKVFAEPTLSLTGKLPASQLPCVATRTTENEPYRRKKRRKTRADRYELKLEQSRHTHAILKRTDGSNMTSVKRQRKTRRATENVTASVVHNFNAPNVKRDRLTLQPTPNPGLFNKGKASSPFKGRGLSDLAFSELKFLQKRKGLHDAAIPAETGKTRRPKDRPHQNEDEISAYFAPTRPPLVKRDVNLVFGSHLDSLPKKTPVRSTVLQHHVSENSLARAPIQPIEGQVAAARPQRLIPTSATYFSWSTSVSPEAEFKARPIRLQASVQRSEPEWQHTRNDPRDASPSYHTSPTKFSPQALQIRNEVNNEGQSCHENESAKDQCVTEGEHVVKEEARWHKRRGNIRADVVCLGKLREDPLPAPAESLPLPSSPPYLRLQSFTAQPAQEGTQEASGPQRLGELVVTSNGSHRSSSPMAKLLNNCDALFVAHSSARAPSGVVEESLDDEILEAENVTQTVCRIGRDNQGLLNKDLRRSWRLASEFTPSTDLSQWPRLRQDLVLDNYEGSNQLQEGEEGYRNQEDAMTCIYHYNDEQEDDEYAFGDQDEEVSSTYGHVEEEERQTQSEDFVDFWRPNILY